MRSRRLPSRRTFAISHLTNAGSAIAFPKISCPTRLRAFQETCLSTTATHFLCLAQTGLRYYLPAYLLYALDHPASDIMMFTVFHLTPRNEAQGYFEERFGLFSEAQKQAVAAFLEDVMNYQYYRPHEQEFERAMEPWPMRPNPSAQPTPASRRE